MSEKPPYEKPPHKALSIDRDKMNIRQSVYTILNLLNDFIPRACYQDAQYRLMETFDKDGIELTSKLMRKEYEAWKKLSLDKLEMVNPVFKVPER